MSEMDYTYAERWNRTGYKYATPIDESVADGVVDALAVDATYLEALTDKFKDDAEYIAGLIAGLVADNSYPEKLADYLSTDAEYLAGVIAAFVADATYPAALGAALAADNTYREGVADYLATDAEYLAGVAGAVAGELVSTFNTAVTGEIAHIGPADAVTLTVSDTALDVLGDNGVVPGSVTFTITANDDSETLAVTDSDNGDGTGNLSGAGVAINVLDDGASIITYATGAWTITADEALKQNEDILVDYSYSRDALVGDVGLTDGALAAIADELEGDTDFLDAVGDALAINSDFLEAVKTQANPIWWVNTDVSAEAADVVTVTFTQFNVGGTAETGRAQAFRLFLYSDQIGTAVLPAGITMAATTGMILGPIVATKEIQVMTDSVTGTLVLEFTDASDQTVTFDVVLVNDVTGECHTATCVFVDDTP